MRETITVIVPVYNVEPYIERCIESIRNQIYRDLQIILVDDGSTDASGDICDRFSRQDPRVQVVHKANGGLVSARKAGLAHAKGAYVGFVDGDDYVDPSMYEELLACLVETDSDFVQVGYTEESQTGTRVVTARENRTFDDFDKCDIIARYFLGYEDPGMIITANVWSKLYKRKLIAECYKKVPDDAWFGEDFLTVCHCLCACDRFSVKKGTYCHYRIRENSLSRQEGNATVFAQLGDMHRHLCDIFEQHGYLQQLQTYADKYLVQCMLGYLIPLGKQRGILHRSAYYYPNINQLLDKRVVIYGAGKVGKDYYRQMDVLSHCEVVALMDTHPERCSLEHVEVQGLDQLRTMEFDIVVIAAWNENMMREIKKGLLDTGVPVHKISWEHPAIMIQ